MLYGTNDRHGDILFHRFDPLAEPNGLAQNGRHVPAHRVRIDTSLKIKRPSLPRQRKFSPSLKAISTPAPASIDLNLGMGTGRRVSRAADEMLVFSGPTRNLLDLGMGTGPTGQEPLTADGLDGLGKFTLKKVVKQATNPVAQVARNITSPARVVAASAARAVGVKSNVVNKALALSKKEQNVSKIGSKAVKIAAITAGTFYAAPMAAGALKATALKGGGFIAKAGQFFKKAGAQTGGAAEAPAADAQLPPADQPTEGGAPTSPFNTAISKLTHAGRKIKSNIQKGKEIQESVQSFLPQRQPAGGDAFPAAAATPELTQADMLSGFKFTGSTAVLLAAFGVSLVLGLRKGR